MSIDPLILHQQIETSLQKAKAQKTRLQNNQKRFDITNTLFSALSTFVAGLATVSGSPVAGSGDDGWRLTCGIAAVLTLAATVVSGIQQSTDSSKVLSETNACVTKLRVLQMEMLNPNFKGPEISQQYQKVLASHPQVDC
jgi:hypothetical protein